MIDKQFIIDHVDSFIEEFRTAYPDSDIFNENSEDRDNFIDAVHSLFTERMVSKEYEDIIHYKLLMAVRQQNIEKKKVLTADNDPVQAMLGKYGQEVGSFLLNCNRLIREVCQHEFDRFEGKKRAAKKV